MVMMVRSRSRTSNVARFRDLNSHACSPLRDLGAYVLAEMWLAMSSIETNV